MNLHRMLVPAALMLAAPLAAQQYPSADLKVVVAPAAVEFHVNAPPADPFLGVVLIATDPVQICCLPDLPPLLVNSIVLGWGVGTQGRYELTVPEAEIPAGVEFYVQGIAMTDTVLASEVRSFVLDVTVPE